MTLGIVGSAAVAINVLAVPFLTPAVRKLGIPYVPATHRQLVCILSRLKKNSKRQHSSMVDLGSGDGRIVIAAAKRGFQAMGIELNLWLVLFSRARAILQGVSHLATFKRQDMWKADLSKFDNVVVFGVDEVMGLMEEKVKSDVCPGTRVIVSRFRLPNTNHKEQIETGSGTVWVYEL